MQVDANFKAGFKTVGATLKEAVADPDRQGKKEVSDTRDLGLVGEGGQTNVLRDFMQGLQKENAELYADCAAENAAGAKSLPEVSVLRVGKAAQKKMLEELTRRLSEELSARERSVAEKKHTKDAVDVKNKLTEHVKHLSVRVTESKGEVVIGPGTVVDPNVKVKAAEKRA